MLRSAYKIGKWLLVMFYHYAKTTVFALGIIFSSFIAAFSYTQVDLRLSTTEGYYSLTYSKDTGLGLLVILLVVGMGLLIELGLSTYRMIKKKRGC